MYQNLNEKIEVLALFEKGRVIPKAFKWKGRKSLIERVNLEYQEREGSSINYFFAVGTKNGNQFKIKYNNEKLTWHVEEIWQD